MQSKNRTWFWTIGIVGVGLIIGIILSNQKEAMERKPSLTRQKPIKVLTIRNKDITLPIQLDGFLYAFDKVELFAEVTGVLQKTPQRFKEGYRYQKNSLLIQIDDRVYKNNVLAQKSSLLNQLTLLLPDLSIDFPERESSWEDYLKNYNLNKPLAPLPKPASEKERYYIASRNIYNQFYQIKSMEATLAKYALRAPFDGVVTEANINPGTLVRVGQKLGEFTSTEIYEMEAVVNAFDVNQLEIGMSVVLEPGSIKGKFTGKIQRINSVIDRTAVDGVKVYIHLSDHRLRAGMYMSGQVEATPIEKVFTVPKDLLVGTNQVYVIRDNTLHLKSITPISERGGQVIARGLTDGTVILGEVWDEAKEGQKLPVIEKNSLHQQGTSFSSKQGQHKENRKS